MFSIFIVFLCNTLLVALIFEERFKLIPTTSVYAGSFILSLIIDAFVSTSYPDPMLRLSLSLGINIVILLIASIFISSNNLTQKILVALTMYFNYQVTTTIFANPDNDLMGYMSVGTYVLATIIVLCVYRGPMHYLYRRSVDLTSVIMCLFALCSVSFTNGFFKSFLQTDNFIINVFFVLLPNLFIAIALRASYSIAKQKEKDVKRYDLYIIRQILVDNFNAMLVNINSIKNLRNNMSQINNSDPLLQIYCQNPNLNAVVATKVAYAKSIGADVELNISIENQQDNILLLCSSISHLMDIATSSIAKLEEKQISLTMQEHSNGIIMEIIYNWEKPNLGQAYKFTLNEVIEFIKKTAIENIFKQDMLDNDLKQQLLLQIVNEEKGKMKITSYENKRKINVSI